MQAAKIIPHQVYAVSVGDKLLRFDVKEVITVMRRKGAKSGPHDYSSEVAGVYVDGPLSEPPRALHRLDVDRVLGEFTEYTELVERKAQADAAQKARAVAEAKQADADRLILYEFVGETPPTTDEYGQLFRSRYGKVEISEKGAKALAARVHDLKGHK